MRTDGDIEARSRTAPRISAPVRGTDRPGQGALRAGLRAHAGAARIAGDAESADLSDVAWTPAFFVHGRRHHGAYDIGSLPAPVRAAATA